MQKRIYIGLALLVMALGVMGWSALHQGEPLYRGKPASFWLHYDYGPTDHPFMDYEEVWEGLGPRAVPFLVGVLNQKGESVLSHRGYVSVWEKLPGLLRTMLPKPRPELRLDRAQAMCALAVIGPASRPAIPTLLHIMNTEQDPLLRQTAGNVVRAIAPEIASAIGAGF